MENELEVRVKQELGKISFNFEEAKKAVAERIALYDGAEFSEDTAIKGKKEVAGLRNWKKAWNDARIKAKKEYMIPYDDFASKVDEITSLIDKPIELIDGQLEKFEKKRIQKKKEEIQLAYDESIGEVGEYLPLSKIYDSKWENKGTTIKIIKEEIEQVVSSTHMAVTTIKGMNSDAVAKALEQYKQDLSLANAIAYINKHEQMKADILAKEEQKRKGEEERKRIAEENRIKEQERQRVIGDERKRVAEENRIREEERLATEKRLLEIKEHSAISNALLQEEPFTPEQEKFFDSPLVEDDGEMPFEVESEEQKVIFIVVASTSEINQIEMYMNSIGVNYRRDE